MTAVKYQTMPALSTDAQLLGFRGDIPHVRGVILITPSVMLSGYYEIVYSAGKASQFASPPIAGSRVAAWLERNGVSVDEFTSWQAKKHTPSTRSTPRHVYFIRDEDGFIKIGSTSHVGSRLKQLQTSSRQRLSVMGSHLGSTADEKALHARFADDHARGEWFYPSRELLAYIERNTK